jgi:ketosteroid isomerase-like protein
MQEAENTKVIQEAYAAFGRGDVQAILDRIDDNAKWIGVYGTDSRVPTSGERRGKAAIGEFFKQVAEHVNFSRFEPKEFIATGDKVVALGHYTATTPIGKGFDSDFVMVFTLRNGKVVHFQEFCNSAAINAAYAAGAAA